MKSILCFTVVFLITGFLYAGDGQIDIATLPYTISTSGSYVVVKDLTLSTQDTHGITISVDNVTLDLNGHTLTGAGKAVGTTGSGIFVSSTYINISISNGTVRDWRQDGINATNTHNSQFKNLRVHNNGGNGISTGIVCLVKENNCSLNGNHGISTNKACTIIENTCYNNTYFGIFADGGSTINSNTCYLNGEDGITSNINGTIIGNTCLENSSDGISAGESSTIIENTCCDNGASGIYAYSGSTLSGNSCQSNTTWGIQAGTSCTVSKNTCRLNGTDGISADTGSLVSGNTCGLNTGDGIQVPYSCRVVDNSCNNNGYLSADGAGIHITSSRNSIEHNLVTSNDRGIDCNPATGNYIASNRARTNTTNYDIIAGNTQGSGDLANISF